MTSLQSQRSEDRHAAHDANRGCQVALKAHHKNEPSKRKKQRKSKSAATVVKKPKVEKVVEEPTVVKKKVSGTTPKTGQESAIDPIAHALRQQIKQQLALRHRDGGKNKHEFNKLVRATKKQLQTHLKSVGQPAEMKETVVAPPKAVNEAPVDVASMMPTLTIGESSYGASSGVKHMPGKVHIITYGDGIFRQAKPQHSGTGSESEC